VRVSDERAAEAQRELKNTYGRKNLASGDPSLVEDLLADRETWKKSQMSGDGGRTWATFKEVHDENECLRWVVEKARVLTNGSDFAAGDQEVIALVLAVREYDSLKDTP
jgi:hypothetical protein